MAIERIIGIDFGTSTSVVRVKTYVDGVSEGSMVDAKPVKFDGADTLPTLAFYDSGYDEHLIGFEAENMADNAQGVLYRNFKLDLLSADEAVRQKAEELIGYFFRYIYEAYSYEQEHFTPCDTETTYVSYPAKWPKEIADTMIRIASEAGFKNVKGLDEPSAAIHTVLIQKGNELGKFTAKSLNVLMVDMGAGTTDLALCRYTPETKKAEIISTWPQTDGYALFGGREIDEVLWKYVKDYIADCGLPDIVDEKPYLPKSKAWKEASVSPSLRKGRPITACAFINSLFYHIGGQPKQFPPIVRESFEELLGNYLKRFPELINGILYNTPAFDPEDVDLVVLAGGHSQWYFADEILSGKLMKFGAVTLPKIQREPERIIRLSLPQETVALGLVYQRLTEEPKIQWDPPPERDDGPNVNMDDIYKSASDSLFGADKKEVKRGDSINEDNDHSTRYKKPTKNPGSDCLRSVFCQYGDAIIGNVSYNISRMNFRGNYGRLDIYPNRIEFIFDEEKHPKPKDPIIILRSEMQKNYVPRLMSAIQIVISANDKYNSRKVIGHCFYLQSKEETKEICELIQNLKQ